MNRRRGKAARPRHLDNKLPAAARSATTRNTLLGAAVLIAAVLAAYGPALRGGFVWDDPRYVTENPVLTEPSGLYRIWFDVGATVQYYPLVFTSFWIESRLWGLQPLGYHLVNVLLHAANAVLVWRVLRRLSVPGAWLAAGIFALHPVHVESVAWITERKNVLSGLFYLTALLAYLRFAPPDGEGSARGRPWRFYALAVGLFACALLSKTVTCSLPAAIALLLWWRRGRIGRSDALALLPLFAVGAALALTTIWLEKHNVGAQGQAWELSVVQRCLIAGRALWFYAGKLVWPLPLIFTYPKWQIDAGQWWQYLFPAGAVALPLGLWVLRRRIGKGPLVAALCFAGTLLPALGFVDVYPMRYSYVADHFQYLASIAPIALLVAVITMLARLLPSRRTVARLVPSRRVFIDLEPATK